MITLAQAQSYLREALGLGLPDFLVRAAVERVEALEPAMVAAGYGEAQQIQVQTLAVALVAASGAPRRVSSQGGPTGASQSFKYADGDLSALRRSLQQVDTAGTVAALVGPDPSGGVMLLVTA